MGTRSASTDIGAEKKCGGTPPHQQLALTGAPGTARKNYPRRRPPSTPKCSSALRLHSQKGNHPAVATAGGAVAVEAIAVVGRAPGGPGDAGNPQPGRLGG